MKSTCPDILLLKRFPTKNIKSKVLDQSTLFFLPLSKDEKCSWRELLGLKGRSKDEKFSCSELLGLKCRSKDEKFSCSELLGLKGRSQDEKYLSRNVATQMVPNKEDKPKVPDQVSLSLFQFQTFVQTQPTREF
jgi:hypothetical protein